MCIRDRSGVEVTKPNGCREHCLVDALFLPAVGNHHEEREVGKPAQDERTHDDPQLRRSLLFFGQDKVRVSSTDLLLLQLLLLLLLLLTDTVGVVSPCRAAAEQTTAALPALTPPEERREKTPSFSGRARCGLDLARAAPAPG